jgi:hypothetical protein
MSIDKVEWLVGYKDEQGVLHTAQNGAQSVFSRSSAQKLAKQQGAPWDLFHFESLLSPEEHDRWSDLNKDTPPAGGPAWGSNWSK